MTRPDEPLRVVSCLAALENKRDVATSRWPKRGGEHARLEPLARPIARPSFQFAPGATVFTIGSCFARNIEESLERRGFVVPTRRFRSEDSSGRATDNWMLDTYGAPAIYNELAWAFGEVPYRPEDHVAEIRPGLFADKHLSGRVPLETWDAVTTRRRRIFEVTRSALTADVVIMTLGLAEVWWDAVAGVHLNTRPLQSTLLAEPERYELHVLSYGQVEAILDRTLELLFRRGRPDLKVVLTVSPVPMTTTYTGTDVLVANGYSKSVLRAGAEAVAARHRAVDYFPTYESVVLSERERAWEDDGVHVRPELIDLNVTAMLAAYAGAGDPKAGASGSARALPPAEAERDLRQARALLRAREPRAAIAAARPLLDGPLRSGALRIQASALLSLNDPHAAEAALREALTLAYNQGGLHGLLGRALDAQGRLEEAAECFAEAVRYAPDVPVWTVEHAEALAKLGRLDDARRTAAAGCRVFRDHSALKRLAERLGAGGR